jgi:uncharacterized tellurite resistance protein B-like protein
MKPKELNTEQREALLDLLVLGMYADNHLAISEDDLLHDFLVDCGVVDEVTRQNLIDDAISRAGLRVTNEETRHGRLIELASRLSTQNVAQAATAILEEFLAVDGNVNEGEKAYLTEVRRLLHT